MAFLEWRWSWAKKETDTANKSEVSISASAPAPIDGSARMFWLLLYPFRGTTDPPQFDSQNPIRRNITKYGVWAARHSVITLLISVALAATLIFPFPFLYTNDFTSGSSNLPKHVWTSAQPYNGRADTRPDVVMRSIWVHGSFMKALQQDVLLGALELQDELLGPTIDFAPRRSTNQISLDPLGELTLDQRDTLHAINGLTNSSWFFHSPLQYWSSSSERISADQDVIATVNANSHQSTSVNVTLRHSIVFSGKRFEDHVLVAADALVITLVHMLDSPVGEMWERKAEEIAQRNSDKWNIYPAGGRSFVSTLYQFRFQPVSFVDDLGMALIYTLMVVSLLYKISHLRALKSRLGLLIAVIVQVAVSVMSSFTICAVLKIDLSRIPWGAYPLVTLGTGLNNILNLIHALPKTRSEASPAIRIGEALGKTIHLALATLAMNLIAAVFLSKIGESYPAITGLCAFAVTTIILDFILLLTFFIAVLSVDIQRTDLSDALSRATTGRYGHAPSTVPKLRPTWFEALLGGEAQISARIASSTVLVGTMIVVQWHFCENETWGQTLLRIVPFLSSQVRQSTTTASELSMNINQARSPTAWLRMQDHETAHEVISIVKPNAHSYIARVYDPIIFVLNGSDRTRNEQGVRRFLPAAYDFVRNRLGLFIVSVVLAVAAVSLLMNYLLWNQLQDDDDENREDEPLLSVRTLGGHSLDVVLIATSRDGVMASVGLDRLIRLWDVRRSTGYILRDLDTFINPFPILAITIDNDSNWLAILSGNDMLYLWNIPERRWGPSMAVEMKRRAPLSFVFRYDKDEFINPLIIVHHNGLMTELHPETKVINQLQVCRSPLLCARQHFEKPSQASGEVAARIITSSKKGCVHIATHTGGDWVSDGLELPERIEDQEIVSVVPLPVLSSFLAARHRSVDLVDVVTGRVTYTFTTSLMKPGSLRCFHSSRRRPQCGSVGLLSFSIAYTCAITGKVMLHSYLPEREGDTICFRDPLTPGSQTCCLWKDTKMDFFEVNDPGQWEALHVGYLVGVRRIESQSEPSGPNTVVRRRGGKSQETKSEAEAWEVWSISSKGLVTTSKLFGYKEQSPLLTSSAGPMQKIGKRALVVGVGNIIKVITVGRDNFDAAESSTEEMGVVGAISSRRKKGTLQRKKTT